MVEDKLQRNLSPVNVWALALGCIIGWGAFVMPGNTFLPQGGPLGTVIAMACAAGILIVIAFNYQYMIKRFPVAGGGFIYAQKTFGRVHGFICAWFLGLAYLSIVPLNATALALIGRNLLGGGCSRSASITTWPATRSTSGRFFWRARRWWSSPSWASGM